jgi:hypothetical protein
MSVPRPGGVVIDTLIFSWLTEEDDDPIADAYRALIGSRSVVLAFQTLSAPSRSSRSPSPTT